MSRDPNRDRTATGPDARIRIAETDAEIERCHPVLAQLRPRVPAAGFTDRIRDLMEEGYRLVFLEDEGKVRCVAGFRVLVMLSRGRFIYVDDLVTDEAARSRGYGRAMLDWLIDHARAAGCDRLDLDSGVERARAHRFYFRSGMQIVHFHFSMRLDRG